MIFSNLKNAFCLIFKKKKAAKELDIPDFSSNQNKKNKLTVVLTQYKRDNLIQQLQSVFSQTLQPDRVIVFQNEEHYDISYLREDFNFDLVVSTFNTKYFGRFAYCLSLESEYFIILDDDIVPGRRCFELYVSESKRLNAIVGGNGRIAVLNPKIQQLNKPPDIGIRRESILVDFVGHMWVFRKEWLYDMFSVAPFTLETGEDMHFCFSAKLKSGIPSYVCKQRTSEEFSDISFNKLADDEFSSFKYMPKENRVAVENYFKTLGLGFIQNN